MSTALARYIRKIQRRSASLPRPWYWEKNAQRSLPIAYLLEYNPLTLGLKAVRYARQRKMLAPLMRSNPASSRLHDEHSFGLAIDKQSPNEAEIIFPGAAQARFGSDRIVLSSGNRKLIIAHAYYEPEAAALFEKIKGLADCDFVLTTPVPAIRDRFLTQFNRERSACYFLENRGRDILPFLLVLAFHDLSRYTHFIKVHTKRSSHVTGGNNWFVNNIELLVGDPQMTDELFRLIDPKSPSIFGLQTRPLSDHFRGNRHWLRALLPAGFSDWKQPFIPGTMFAGSAEFLRRLSKEKLHLRAFEAEAGQLDGCLSHALERYFGYFARSEGGRCDAVNALLDTTSPDPSAFQN